MKNKKENQTRMASWKDHRTDHLSPVIVRHQEPSPAASTTATRATSPTSLDTTITVVFWLLRMSCVRKESENFGPSRGICSLLTWIRPNVTKEYPKSLASVESFLSLALSPDTLRSAASICRNRAASIRRSTQPRAAGARSLEPPDSSRIPPLAGTRIRARCLVTGVRHSAPAADQDPARCALTFSARAAVRVLSGFPSSSR
jgi:hypothetical protein